MDEMFSVPHTVTLVTCWLQQGYEFTLLPRLAFIFVANVIKVLTLICRLSVFPFSCVSSPLSEMTDILHLQDKLISRGWASVPGHRHGAPASVSPQA